jgi:TolB-like protein
MITGQLPFKGEYEQVVMYSIVNEEPEPILTASERTDVPMALDQMVNKALAKRADERYQQVDDLLVDLKSLSKELETAGKLQSRRIGIAARVLRKKWLKKAVIPAGVVLVVALGFLLFRPLLFEEALISEPKPIAVISFENQTGDEQYDYLQKAIPNLLITSLEQSKYLRVATWERMHDLLKQIGKENVEKIDKELGFELCRMDGINIVVIGSYTRAGEVFVTDVKVLEVTTKALMKSAKSQGKGVASILDRQIDELSREIARGVGLSKRQIEAAQMPIAEVTTTSMEAYNYFMRGREEWEKLYFDDARKFLEKAIEIDSTFAMAYLYLTLAYVGLDRTKVKETLEKAKAFAEHATDKEKLYINYFYALYIEHRQESLAMLERMAKQYPQEKRVYLNLR